MNIMFLSYWGLNDGLTAATIFPHLEILASFPNINKIVLVTIERDSHWDPAALPVHKKISHKALISKRPFPNMLNKIFDFVDFPGKLIHLCKQENISRIIARGAPPGAIAMKICRRIKIPFYVESFEPHSEYMYESDTWKWYDPRYIFQKHWEKEIQIEATALMPVADNFRKRLIAEGVPHQRIDIMPCCVPINRFQFNANFRKEIREQLNANKNLTGIYTGKFGGIYYRDEAFDIFKIAFEVFKGDFFLIILSPDDKKWIKAMITSRDIPSDKVYIAHVAHNKVPEYLSAADFAFSLQSPKKSNLYLSPIKNAEYWAAGLPILITSGVGDDASFIEQEKAGAIFRGAKDDKGIREGLSKISFLVEEKDIRLRMLKLSEKHRSFSIVKEVYQKWHGE